MKAAVGEIQTATLIAQAGFEQATTQGDIFRLNDYSAIEKKTHSWWADCAKAGTQ
jgi:hypothetical protein